MYLQAHMIGTFGRLGHSHHGHAQAHRIHHFCTFTLHLPASLQAWPVLACADSFVLRALPSNRQSFMYLQAASLLLLQVGQGENARKPCLAWHHTALSR